jgi:hypothetical protein
MLPIFKLPLLIGYNFESRLKLGTGSVHSFKKGYFYIHQCRTATLDLLKVLSCCIAASAAITKLWFIAYMCLLCRKVYICKNIISPCLSYGSQSH